MKATLIMNVHASAAFLRSLIVAAILVSAATPAMAMSDAVIGRWITRDPLYNNQALLTPGNRPSERIDLTPNPLGKTAFHNPKSVFARFGRRPNNRSNQYIAYSSSPSVRRDPTGLECEEGKTPTSTRCDISGIWGPGPHMETCLTLHPCWAHCTLLHESIHMNQLAGPCIEAQIDYENCDDDIACKRDVEHCWRTYFNNPCNNAHAECEAHSASFDCLTDCLLLSSGCKCPCMDRLRNDPFNPNGRGAAQLMIDYCRESTTCGPETPYSYPCGD